VTDNDESLELVKHAIREVGLRATPARIAVLQMLLNSNSPQPHSIVAERLSPLGIDSATVFRNLNCMTQVGLLRRAELGDHVWRFEAVRDKQHGHDSAHPHFLCVGCGEVTCLDAVQLSVSSQRVAELVGEVTEILVRGHCNHCLEHRSNDLESLKKRPVLPERG
jgi:Fur family ferric uptake transcriptional regulator